MRRYVVFSSEELDLLSNNKPVRNNKTNTIYVSKDLYEKITNEDLDYTGTDLSHGTDFAK